MEKKNKNQTKKVLIINSENIFKRGRNQNTLESEHVAKIFEVYKNFESIEGLSNVVSDIDIQAKSFSLNISQYVAGIQDKNPISLKENINKLEDLNIAAQESRATLKAEFEKWGLSVTK